MTNRLYSSLDDKRGSGHRLLKQDGQTKAIPIVAVTAFATPGDETKALESGCAAYITKPVNVDELLTTIRSFLSASLPQ